MSIYSESKLFLEESIGSILNQSFDNFEFIIINDNPEKLINKDILDKYSKKDSRIIAINNKDNIGLTKSLNLGLKLAKGKYLARMDADDIAYKDRLFYQYSFMEENSNLVASGSFIKIFGKIKRLDNSLPTSPSDFANALFLHNPLPHPTSIIRNDILQENRITYDEGLRYSQDYGLWVTLSDYGKLSNIPKVLLKYRVNDSQISIKNKSEQINCAQTIRKKYLYKELEKVNITISNLTLEEAYEKVNSVDFDRIKKSYILLLLFLSFNKTSFFMFFKMLLNINFKILYMHRKTILQRVLFKNIYPSYL